MLDVRGQGLSYHNTVSHLYQLYVCGIMKLGIGIFVCYFLSLVNAGVVCLQVEIDQLMVVSSPVTLNQSRKSWQISVTQLLGGAFMEFKTLTTSVVPPV